jgi:hypothetical protein
MTVQSSNSAKRKTVQRGGMRCACSSRKERRQKQQTARQGCLVFSVKSCCWLRGGQHACMRAVRCE